MIFMKKKFKMIQVGAVGGEIWRIGSEKWGSRRGQLGMCTPICSFQAKVFSAGVLRARATSWY